MTKRPTDLKITAVVALLAAATCGADAEADEPNLSRVPGVVIDHVPASTGRYVGSPSLAVLPDGGYLATHDLFGPKSNEHVSATTRVFRSSDRGETWRPVAEIDGAFWSTLFTHRGAAYLIGTTRHHGDFVIRRSADGGTTWTTPKDRKSGLLLAGEYHCAPVPVVEHGGRLWRGVEDAGGGKEWGKRYRASMISVPTDADLLDAGAWTASNLAERDPSWLGGTFNAWLEGNAVVTPEGKVVDILRVDAPGDERVAIVGVGEDGRTVSFNPQSGFVSFPGGSKKFTIRRDPQGGLYWSLVNWIAPQSAGRKNASTRNTLALVSSPDLREWTVRCVVLHHPDVSKHAFQYVDWLFDGDDLIAVSRTAFDDGLGGAHNAHDANLMTFHRVKGFRTLTMADSTPALAATAGPPSEKPAAAGPVVRSEFVYEQAPFLSCHASTIAETSGGSLAAAWFGGTDEGKKDVGIWLARHEGGRWTAPVEVANGVQYVAVDGKEHRHPCWNPVLHQAKDGPLLLFYKCGPSPSTWWGMLTASNDGGKTWSEPRRLPEGIDGPVKNKPLVLPDGRLLCGSSTEHDGWRVHFEITPDLGRTWTRVGPINDGKAIAAIQPSLLVHPAGRLQALGRSRQGTLWTATSADGGLTWGEMILTDLPNPNSGTDAVTLADGRHLLVSNPVTQGRTPLVVSVSADGTAWRQVAVLEDGRGEFSYPAVIQTADGLVHVTYTWKRQRIRHAVLDPARIE